MTREPQIRTLLGPADPARGTTVAPPRATAAQLIAYADDIAVTMRRPARPGRRAVLAGGAAVATAAVTAYVLPSVLPRRATEDGDTPPPPGRVLVPIAYEFDSNPQPAAARLRALATGIAAAPYDTRTGRYAFRHAKLWQPTTLTSAEGFVLGFVEEEHQWIAADGTGRIRNKTIGLEYPNEESRRYWERELRKPTYDVFREDVLNLPLDPAPPTETPTPVPTAPPSDPTRPPTRPADLAELIRAQYGATHAAKWTMELYRSYVVPHQVRATILRILAGLDGFVWRGAATDRAGRTGVAISVTATPPPDNTDRNRYEDVLIFDPRTGALLSHEMTELTPRHEAMFYALILEPGWTDVLG